MAQTVDAQTLEAQTRETAQASQPAAEPTQSQSIAVEIYDQIYHLRGTDPVYIERIAAMVDAKMRAVSAHGNTVDSLRVAVLAALNIADELCCARDRSDNLAGSLQNSQQSLRSRAGNLSHLLDELLEDRKVG
ncbi:cell division protein ZapA [Tunturibacter empetritectus]|uniref:Cell division protein ZapA n=1 Tax=Tunturiibacter empetritectus TaxID=3069691 RepID=A0A7W8MRS5_9BACT|nr:cell division protein ZapA [Edaphobacter lichenicola]MBB5318146.1 cell division protein ZapA [Edaphobacter lichenicola]